MSIKNSLYNPNQSCPPKDIRTAYSKEYKIPGYLISPEILVRTLQAIFNDDYMVKNEFEMFR
ncbi:hypothetical protein GGS23DRAFT_601724 [Durotheca rogersii]|uniref:uncharacterized protein n=1 Tax=Durotheca rogersii TaxID=419775 RepID=UPI002220AE3C|nr:uncharacterized protein GGS23DRAFT_601724 [Durotheca rogersii]KAI5853637.1 hypothetical protein GGS23DRAFT_601724 [Durotheca rogersii]